MSRDHDVTPGRDDHRSAGERGKTPARRESRRGVVLERVAIEHDSGYDCVHIDRQMFKDFIETVPTCEKWSNRVRRMCWSSSGLKRRQHDVCTICKLWLDSTCARRRVSKSQIKLATRLLHGQQRRQSMSRPKSWPSTISPNIIPAFFFHIIYSHLISRRVLEHNC